VRVLRAREVFFFFFNRRGNVEFLYIFQIGVRNVVIEKKKKTIKAMF
jgi:hypothetical protein